MRRGDQDKRNPYLWVARISRMTRILSLLCYLTRIELLVWVGVVSRIDVTRRLAILLRLNVNRKHQMHLKNCVMMTR